MQFYKLTGKVAPIIPFWPEMQLENRARHSGLIAQRE
jgi:hypothetical protein